MDNQDRVVAENIERVDPVVPMFRSEMIMVGLTGLGVGLLVWLAAFLLDRFVFGVVLCQGDNAAECANASIYSNIVAIVIGSIAGLIALVQARTYRPLLTVLAASASLWGLHALMLDNAWYWQLVISAVMFALAYSLFTWIARIRSFVLAGILTVILVVIARLMMSL